MNFYVSCIKPLINKFNLNSKRACDAAVKTTADNNNCKSASNDLFCSVYRAKVLQSGQLKNSNRKNVSLHAYLNGINHYFINGLNSKGLNEKFMLTGFTPRQMIIKTDLEFKQLKPTTKVLNVVRCIGEKPVFFSNNKLYQKRLGIKVGDIIDMKEYAYATSDREYAKYFLTNNKGILYEIEIPAGSRVSCKGELGKSDEIVFPRSSKFECTGKDKVKDNDNDYTVIKLRYINPYDGQRNLDTSV